MMSGNYGWNNGDASWSAKHGYGNFWASTPGSYVDSRYLYFSSTNVYPKGSSNKPYGFTLRRVAQPPLLKKTKTFNAQLCQFQTKKEAPGEALGEPSRTSIITFYFTKAFMSIAIPSLVTKNNRLIPFLCLSLLVR